MAVAGRDLNARLGSTGQFWQQLPQQPVCYSRGKLRKFVKSGAGPVAGSSPSFSHCSVDRARSHSSTNVRQIFRSSAQRQRMYEPMYHQMQERLEESSPKWLICPTRCLFCPSVGSRVSCRVPVALIQMYEFGQGCLTE